MSIDVNGVLEFRGRVDSRTLREDISGALVYLSLRIQDYAGTFNRRIVYGAWTDAKLGTILDDMYNRFFSGATFDEGITKQNCPVRGDGPVIPGKVVFEFVPASQAFNTLINSLDGWFWDVIEADDLPDLRFMESVDSTATEFNINESPSNAFAVELTESLSDGPYRNVQHVSIGANVAAVNNWLENLDGAAIVADTFTLTYDVQPSPTEMKIYYNGVDQTDIGPYTDFTAGTPRQWYYVEGQPKVIRGTATAPVSGDEVLILYQIANARIASVSDGAKITERKAIEGGSGVAENLTSVQDIKDPDYAVTLGVQMLDTYGVLTQTLRIETTKTFLRPGESIDVTRANLELDAATFLIDSCTYTVQPSYPLTLRTVATANRALQMLDNAWTRTADEIVQTAKRRQGTTPTETGGAATGGGNAPLRLSIPGELAITTDACTPGDFDVDVQPGSVRVRLRGAPDGADTVFRLHIEDVATTPWAELTVAAGDTSAELDSTALDALDLIPASKNVRLEVFAVGTEPGSDATVTITPRR
jgi:hypothetical protein